MSPKLSDAAWAPKSDGVVGFFIYGVYVQYGVTHIQPNETHKV